MTELPNLATVTQEMGQRIRVRREQLGWTQGELGKRLGPLLGKPWPRQAVCNAEQGKRQLGVAETFCLAHVLDVPVGSLYGDDGPAGALWEQAVRDALREWNASLAAARGAAECLGRLLGGGPAASQSSRAPGPQQR